MADATVLWEACAAAIQSQVSDVVWQMTFTAAQPVTADDETLVVSVPSTLIRDRIEGRYHTVVHSAVAEVSDDQLTLQIVIREEDPEEDLVLPDPIPPTVELPTCLLYTSPSPRDRG